MIILIKARSHGGRGRRVEEWRLQDTGHVDHFKRHPEEYRERVAAFLDSCLKS